MREVDMAQITE